MSFCFKSLLALACLHLYHLTMDPFFFLISKITQHLTASLGIIHSFHTPYRPLVLKIGGPCRCSSSTPSSCLKSNCPSQQFCLLFSFIFRSPPEKPADLSLLESKHSWQITLAHPHFWMDCFTSNQPHSTIVRFTNTS